MSATPSRSRHPLRPRPAIQEPPLPVRAPSRAERGPPRAVPPLRSTGPSPVPLTPLMDGRRRRRPRPCRACAEPRGPLGDVVLLRGIMGYSRMRMEMDTRGHVKTGKGTLECTGDTCVGMGDKRRIPTSQLSPRHWGAVEVAVTGRGTGRP